MVRSRRLARSICMVLSPKMARSNYLVLSMSLARFTNPVLSLSLARSSELVLSANAGSLLRYGVLAIFGCGYRPAAFSAWGKPSTRSMFGGGMKWV
jgi:hypothetical protein